MKSVHLVMHLQSYDDLALARRLAESVRALGGRTYFVGGCVRDALMGLTSKDIDIEVYGISPQALRRALEELGSVLEKGAQFGVLGLKHSNLDIAMPRTESKTGARHRDFDVSVNPYLSTREASMRRDFTINAMMRDVLTGEIVDHWGGQTDLQDRIIRRMSSETFADDPLRVFRAAQFAARFDARIEADTLTEMAEMDVTDISRERVQAELDKALLKAARPSGFFRALQACGHLKEFFPEVEAMIGVPQNPVYHPEGDVFEHTMLVLDEGARLRHLAVQPLPFLYACLLHDAGKVDATEIDENGKITSHMHFFTGVPLAHQAISRLTDNKKLIQYVENMVLLHMRPNILAANNSKKNKTRQLFDESVCPEDLILLSRADASGKLDAPYDMARWDFLQERLIDYREVMHRPMVTGADLLAAGFAPGEDMKRLLARAKKLHFSGITRERALRQIVREEANAGGIE